MSDLEQIPKDKNIIVQSQFEFLWDGESDPYRYIVLQGGAGSGKAVTKDTRVVTPYGYKTIEELDVGDTVCTVDGSVTKVIQKWHPETHKVYRITFADGRECCAGEEHLWKYCIDNKVYKNGKRWKIGTTESIKQMMNDRRNNLHRKNFYIPLPNPVYFLPKGKLRIDPYILGLLLGKGYISEKSSLSLTVSDEELKKYLVKLGLHYVAYSKNGTIPSCTFNMDRFKKDVAALGLGKMKSDMRFIPEQYKCASIKDRWELLRGLMDADGVCGTDGAVSFRTISKRLADDVCWVVRSLGGCCSISSKKDKSCDDTSYSLHIRMKSSEILFHIKRKQDEVKPYNGGNYELKLGIESIEEIEYADDIYCIAVEDCSSLFMVEDFIVTHNSKALCQRLVYMFLTYPDINIYVVRASNPALVRSVYLGPDPSIVKELSIWGCPVTQWLNKTERTIKNPANGSSFTFIGLDDPEKIKSINANYVWIEEATELNVDKFNQLNLRLRRENPVKGKINQMYLSYNPISYNNWVIQTFQTNVPPEREVQIYRSFTNFSQNKFVSLENVKDWLTTAQNDYDFYQTYVLGIPGIPLGQVYKNITLQSSIEWPSEVWDIKPYYGVDWGFIDPMVLVEARDVRQASGEVYTYVRCLYYETEKHTSQLIKYMKEIGITSGYDIYCDSAEADRRSELLGAGFTAFKAMKDIRAGISHLQGLKIILDNSGKYGDLAAKEILGYTWKKDPDNQERYLDEPVDENNHFCFTGDTLVTTLWGKIRMDDIRVGDYVLTRKGYKKVTNWNLTRRDAPIVTVKVKFNQRGNLKTKCTKDHRFWSVTDSVFKPICEFKEGETMLQDDGWIATFEGILDEGESANVFNITVEDEHEYFANGLLVSNCDSMRYAIFTRHMRNPKPSIVGLELNGVRGLDDPFSFDPEKLSGSGSLNYHTPQ